MHQLSVIFTVMSIFLLSVLAAPLPSDQALVKRDPGRGTWFYDEANESACGYWDKDNDSIVAISAGIYGPGSYCGKWVWITANGVTASAMVADECEGCGPNDLDMSIGLFKKFDSLDVGVLSITWGWE
ncbi:RlpA-like double-psi beta-barrel-protein domain-containing protein-containing protein [Boletus edulis BED1]|uniref:RlpA-like double-psi beta-barrel-protein domain-containing protein-containing protein n=1 Tax=Boletus edulis BED1 TaxID=1328754 RepID=A0AAD4G8H5_BOLED|nr:RlpA-like double-psi beta-barrel-protein domain-containing protein-containing protein [Boletus edulis BED1]